MHLVAKIDIEKYKCITKDIVTDEVVLTENQRQHIFDRHPDSYISSIEHLQTVFEDPDYIIEDKHKNTGLIVKELLVNDRYIQLVLRLCTSMDDPDYKNSIISCWEISDKRLQNYLRNRRILYKKE